MHALEKILAKAAGKDHVRTGEILDCQVDLAGINDLYLQAVTSFGEMGGKQVFAPDKTIVFLDHYAPASAINQAANQKAFRQFCETQGIRRLMDVNQGVCHQVIVDKGYAKPGQLIIITDSHTTTHGALGAFSTGVGATDLAVILCTGSLWLKVPGIIRIHLEGKPARGVFAKDIILHIIGQLGADFAVYKGIEFTGPVLEGLSVSERMALCNMTTEMGAKASYIQPDQTTLSFLQAKGVTDYQVFETDPGYCYEDERVFNISSLPAQVAAPHSVDNVHDLETFAGTPIHQAFIGTCTGGRLQDLAAAARILENQTIHPRCRLLIVPASRQVLLDAVDKGYIQTLVSAGATLVTPGCSACLGTHQGILAQGETCITSGSRNFPGRMGDVGGQIFLASPASVAAAALNGCIIDPAKYLD